MVNADKYQERIINELRFLIIQLEEENDASKIPYLRSMIELFQKLKGNLFYEVAETAENLYNTHFNNSSEFYKLILDLSIAFYRGRKILS